MYRYLMKGAAQMGYANMNSNLFKCIKGNGEDLYTYSFSLSLVHIEGWETFEM